jgi:hypothetical protein
VFEFDLGIAVLTEYDADGFLGAQPDVFGEQSSGVQAYELHHPYGFQGRPNDPDVGPDGTPKTGAALLYWLEGSLGHALALQDPRVQSKLPQLKKGGSIQYDRLGAFDVFSPGDTSTVRTTYLPYAFDANGVPQKAHSITCDGSSGNESISVVHGDGHGVMLTPTGSAIIKNKSGDAYVEVKDGQIVLNGNVTLNGGATIGSPTGALPVALAAPLITWAAAVVTACAANVPTIVIPPLSPTVAATKTSAA